MATTVHGVKGVGFGLMKEVGPRTPRETWGFYKGPSEGF